LLPNPKNDRATTRWRAGAGPARRARGAATTGRAQQVDIASCVLTRQSVVERMKEKCRKSIQ
jgi:hypothetical protein